jgi:acetyl-CoA synthetase
MLPQADDYAQLVDRFRWQIPERYNIGVDVCDKWAETEPERVALLHVPHDPSQPFGFGQIQPYTFGQIKVLSNRMANLLAAHSIAPGDRVAVLLPQAPETAYAHVAIYKLGAIAVPLFTLFGLDALTFRLQDSRAKAVITDSIGAAKLMQVREQLPDLAVIFCVNTGTRDAADVLDLHALLADQSDSFTPHPVLAEDPALIIYTSGTMGPPKGALHAHHTLLGHLPGVEMSHDFFPQAGDRIWTPADWAWIGGLLDVLMPAWHHGVTVVSHRFEKFSPEAAFALMARYKIRNAFLPPTALKMMRMVEDPARRWAYHLRTIASGGESLGEELLAWGKRTFRLTINEFYGQTECNMIVSSCGTLFPAQPDSMGRPVPGHTLAVVNDAGQLQPPDTLGHIACRRPDPVMFLGYWNNPQATVEKFIGDWLITGDIGTMDDNGNIRFVGRGDDIINSSGYRIGPGEVEDCLLTHPAVKMAAVIGVPDAQRGQVIKAYVVPYEVVPSPELATDLQAYVRVRLAAHAYPRQIVFVDELPLTATGKIMRRTLRTWHEQGT